MSKKFDNILKYITPVYLLVFQVAFILLIGFFGRYEFVTGSSVVPNQYAMYIDVHSMMFVGFGFLMTFLKKYGYGSVGFNFLIAAYVIEWGVIVKGWFEQGIKNDDAIFYVNIKQLLTADFIAASVLISFGAVLGKTTPIQLLIMATIEVVIQVVNQYIGFYILKCYDVGESIYVHIFGAYFGIAVATVLNYKVKKEDENESASYNSDLLAMIGTLFLWIYWPSFNSAGAVDEGQVRAIVNTVLSIASSCITTFMISFLVGRGRFSMVHVQNATLAGGVAVGAVADMNIRPFGAMIIGSMSGIISTLGFRFLTPLLKRLRVHDTCGVNNLHGMPGLVSAITSGIVAAAASRGEYNGNDLYKFYPSRIPAVGSVDYVSYNLATTAYSQGGPGRTAVQQGGYQIAGMALTLGMALVGGVVTGVVMRLPIVQKISKAEMFKDDKFWEIPEEDSEEGKMKKHLPIPNRPAVFVNPYLRKLPPNIAFPQPIYVQPQLIRRPIVQKKRVVRLNNYNKKYFY